MPAGGKSTVFKLRGRLQWPDGRIGVVLCTVEQTVSIMPDLLKRAKYTLTVPLVGRPASQSRRHPRLEFPGTPRFTYLPLFGYKRIH